MKTFDEFYEELKNTDNTELNNLRQKAKKESKKRKIIEGIICLIIDILFVLFLLKCKELYAFIPLQKFKVLQLLPLIMPILFINLFVVVIANILFGKSQSEYNQRYKKIVVNKIMNNFYDNLEYFPQKPMPEYIYKKLEYEYYNKYSSEDYLEALIDNKYNVQMAEVLTQKEETHTDSDGDTHTTTITMFHGLFAKIVMDKSINSELKIMQNGKISSNNRLKMDSSKFEKYFDVKASNKIIGMQLLTADVMEELVQFENKTNMKFDIYIKNNELYLRFHSGSMFEAGSLKKEVLDIELIEKYFYMLNFTYNLSNKIINIISQTEI